MNGIHDMGGMQDMGPIRREQNEPVFHAKWEGRVFALEWAVPGEWPYSQERYQIESIPPLDYLRMSYYERWLTSLIEVMVKNGMVTRAEIETGTANAGSTKSLHVVTASEVAALFRPTAQSSRPLVPAARFQTKASVRARNMNPMGHTRLPRYVRGKRGTIERDFGVFPFPDTSAHGLGDKPQHVYSVRFAARELWGEQASPAIPSTSTCGTTTLSPPDSVPYAGNLADLPLLPRDEDGPVFAEPWQAQAFALAVVLSRQGHFTWKEWAAALGEELKASAARGEPDDGSHYYDCWLLALERLVMEKQLSNAGALAVTKEAWADAYRRTPHGKPVELENDWNPER